MPDDPDAYLYFAEAALAEQRIADADALLHGGEAARRQIREIQCEYEAKS